MLLTETELEKLKKGSTANDKAGLSSSPGCQQSTPAASRPLATVLVVPRSNLRDALNHHWLLTKRGELQLAHLSSDFVRVDLGDDRARDAASAGLGMGRANPRFDRTTP
jgi:hypothetical protein